MKKPAVLFCVILLSQFCSLFRAKIVPYPTGVIFPVVEDHVISYEGEIVSSIQKDDHLLYYCTRKGKIYCVDGQKKTMLWKVDVTRTLSSPLYLSENCIYVYDSDSSMYCVDRAGEILWKTTLQSMISSEIAESNGQVYVGSEDGLLFCLDAETGNELWRFQADDAVRSNLVVWENKVLFGCDDQQIYFVDKTGKLRDRYHAGGKVGNTLQVAENLLYFGTDDKYLHCVNLEKLKKKWRIRSGGATFVPPVVAGKRIFFLCWNCVLYCLNKNNGTILWWNSIPSRSYFRVEVIQEKVVVSSFSPLLICFDKETGENRGLYDANQEIKSNPTWLTPYLLVNLHDPVSDTGKLVFLKKEVKAALSSSRKSPGVPNEEVTITARGVGFHLPEYEFSLTRYIMARIPSGVQFPFPVGDSQIVQQSSETRTWDWFPEEEGIYSVGVVVVDEKEEAHARLPFLIRKKAVHLSLTSSSETPEKIGQTIVFSASFSGLVNPRFEFRLSRLMRVGVVAKFPFLILDSGEVVQVSSEEKSWTWTPDTQGMYFVRVIAQDEQESAMAFKAFVINKD
jgi:outer membrane protein assembly factor BamB